MTALLRAADGSTLPLDVGRWTRPPDDVEVALLDEMEAPLLDVGCGPGRLVAAMAERGRLAMGIDPAPTAVAEAHRHGRPVLRRSVFDRFPGEGRWASAVLLDGNIGIGGDPVALLSRLCDVLRPGGLVLAEVEPPGTTSRRVAVRVEAAGRRSSWFPWAVVGVDDVAALAARAGLRMARTTDHGHRAFAWLAVPR